MSNNIKKLDRNVYSLIAAGEVIERPSSMLKELLDNAIDSKATKIEVVAEESGVKSLMVQDNGVGIFFDELPLAIEHHATSKIESVEDISNINTLGFRGEALASIAQVTNLEIISKKENENGGRIIVEGGKVLEHKVHPAINGTRIITRNLFFNIPARLKFLKHKSREFYLLKEVFDIEALGFYNIEFRLKHNNRDVGHYKITSSIKERVFDYLKDELKESDFFEDCIERDNFKIYAIFSNQHIYQNFRKHSYIFLNNRPIDNKALSFAVKNAYTGAIPKEYYPYYFVYISIDAKVLDVNVHPSKKEVRIKNERDIASALYELINKKLVSVMGIHSSNIDKDYNSYMENRSQNSLYGNNNFENSNLENSFPIINREYIENSYDSSRVGGINNQAGNNNNSFLNYPIAIGQIFSSYILAQSSEGMLIIDQHAAYERLNYERIYKSLKNEKLEYEKLLIPLEFEYKDFEIDVLNEAKENISLLGLNFESNSKNSIVVEYLPIYIPKTERLSALVKDILDSFLDSNENNNTLEKFIKNTCNMIACKYSPKAGDRLSITDMQNLIDNLEQENILFSCPHGRPFVLKMSKEYLDKKFCRTN